MEFAANPEHAPLAGIDEHMIHNHPLPTRVMWTSDPRAYERVWFTSQDDDAGSMLVCGMAFYPNLDTAEAYAIVNHRGRHTTVRAHRRLGVDRMDMRVGPFHYEVVQPFKEWRLRLDENEHDLSFDVRWFDTKRNEYRNLGAQSIAANRVFDGVAGYEGFGYQEGEIRVGGETIALDPATRRGTRDHHWGTRDGVGGRAWYSGHQHVVSGLYVEFADWALFSNWTLGNPGSRRRAPGVRSLRYRLRFDDERLTVLGGEADAVLDTGEEKHLVFTRVGHQVAFLRCGMYGGPEGGTPDGDIWQGMYVGDDVVSGETYDITDPVVRRKVAGLDQIQCVVECDGETAAGMFEIYQPLAYERAAAGRSRLSLLDERTGP